MSQLRKIRQNLKLSIDEVADCLGISSGYLSQIELGKRKISEKRAKEIANYYNVSLEQIFLPKRYSIREVES